MKPIKLTSKEREYLNTVIKKGNKPARILTRAHVLLLTHKGFTEESVKEVMNVCRATVSNVKKRYREEGLKGALYDKPRPGQPRKYTNKHEAEIIATACTSPPEGRRHWTLLLLEETLSKRSGLKTINRETIRLILKKHEHGLG